MKSVNDGIARRNSHNDLMGTVGHPSPPLSQSHTYAAPPLKKYKEYSCTPPTDDIPEDTCCEPMLKGYQTE